MAYEKQTWVTGEVITKEKLNHIEDGIANSGGGSEALLVGFDMLLNKFDKTWNEINTAFSNRQLCYAISETESGKFSYPIVACFQNGKIYLVAFIFADDAGVSVITFLTTDPDGYPQRSSGPSPTES